MNTTKNPIIASRANLLAAGQARPVPFMLAPYRPANAMQPRKSDAAAHGDVLYIDPSGAQRAAAFSQGPSLRVVNVRGAHLGSVEVSLLEPSLRSYLDARGQLIGMSRETRLGREVQYFGPNDILIGTALADPDRLGSVLYLDADGRFIGSARVTETTATLFDAAGRNVGSIVAKSGDAQSLALSDALGFFTAAAKMGACLI